MPEAAASVLPDYSPKHDSWKDVSPGKIVENVPLPDGLAEIDALAHVESSNEEFCILKGQQHCTNQRRCARVKKMCCLYSSTVSRLFSDQSSVSEVRNANRITRNSCFQKAFRMSNAFELALAVVIWIVAKLARVPRGAAVAVMEHAWAAFRVVG